MPDLQRDLTPDDFIRAANSLGIQYATIRAVAEVESSGSGFLPDGRPRILYEAHVFGRLTGHKHAGVKDPNGKPISARSWDRSLYGASGAWQWTRLDLAARHDWEAAHKAASWGAFQVLGTNFRAAGQPTIQAFVEAMKSGAPAHLDLFCRFIQENKLGPALQKRAWADFARSYNGPGYAENKYDTKLAAAYAKWAKT